MSTAIATATADGSRLLEACGYDRHLAASIIAIRPDWKKLLDSITKIPQRRNVAVVVVEIRESLGLEAEHARDVYQGRE